MAVFENSRYVNTQVVTRVGWNSPTLDIRIPYQFNEELFEEYEWMDGDTLDGVAFKFYNNSALRWAILDANPKYTSEYDIQSGDRIFIPDFEEVVEKVNV